MSEEIMTDKEVQELMTKIDALSSQLNDRLWKASHANLKVEVAVLTTGRKKAPYLLISLWREILPT